MDPVINLIMIITGKFRSTGSVSFVKPLTIGDFYGGGYYAGDFTLTPNGGVAQYRLIVSPKSSGETTSGWGNTSGVTTSEIDGWANSNLLNSAANPPAAFCRGLTINGYNDWYWPARYELELLYYNLKPTTTNNVTYRFRNSGDNLYAIPPRNTAYGTQVPAQTSVSLFKSTGSEAFDATYYWGSTNEYPSAPYCFFMSMSNGDLNFGSGGSLRIRAVRRVAI